MNLLFDYIANEVVKGYDLEIKVQVRKNSYLNTIGNTIIVGKDFILGVNVYFIYDVNKPRNITHYTLEDVVSEYLENVK